MRNLFPNFHPYNVLVVRLGSLGDLLHTLPAVQALQRRFPKTRFHWAVDDRHARLLEMVPDLDELEVFERKRVEPMFFSLAQFWKGVGAVRDFIRRLRARRFVVSVDFHARFRSGVFSLFSGARLRLGYRTLSEGNYLFNNVHVSMPNGHAIERHMALAAACGADATMQRPRLIVPNAALADVDRFLAEHSLSDKPFVFVHPKTSTGVKEWPLEHWAALMQGLMERHGLACIVGHGPGEREALEDLLRQVPQAVLAPEPDLHGLAALCKRARLVVAPDTGPLHVAAALGTPVVGLYGPTSPDRYGPYWEPCRVVDAGAGCPDRTRCYKKRHTEDATCDCLKKLAPDVVLAACNELLSQGETSHPTT